MEVLTIRNLRTYGLRASLGLLLAVTFMPWSIGAPPPVHAAPNMPNFRIQVLVKSVHIYDDHDWHGAGDIEMKAHLYRCPETPAPCVVGEPGLRPKTYHTHHFDGWSGTTTGLNLTLPHATDPTWGYDLSENAGYPMYDGERYVLRFKPRDRDDGLSGGPDEMGWVDIWLDEETGYHLRAHQQDAAKGGGTRGDYRLDYEVRLTPLPNLVPGSIERCDVPNSTDSLVCVGVANAGSEPSGSFPVTLKIDGQVARDGVMNGGSIGPGQVEEVCTRTQLPTIGNPHHWVAIVDEAGTIPEMNERDNSFAAVFYLQPGTGTAPVPGSAPSASPTPTPTPMPGAAQPDLVVSAIKVNGQAPDGKDDCKAGKNAVSVAVGSLAVHLYLDGDEGKPVERMVNGLAAGQEREIRFDDVRLKEGGHTLSALADPKRMVSETDEVNNNQVSVSATCKDDD